MSVSILLKRFNISQNTEPTRKGSKDIEFTLSFYIQSSTFDLGNLNGTSVAS